MTTIEKLNINNFFGSDFQHVSEVKFLIHVFDLVNELTYCFLKWTNSSQCPLDQSFRFPLINTVLHNTPRKAHTLPLHQQRKRCAGRYSSSIKMFGSSANFTDQQTVFTIPSQYVKSSLQFEHPTKHGEHLSAEHVRYTVIHGSTRKHYMIFK